MDDPPAQREPAPGGLALVQDFVNSTELPGGYEELADIPTTSGWLRAHGFDVIPDETQRRRLIEVREHLRRVLSVNQELPLPEESAARLMTLFDAAAVRTVVDVDGVRLAPVERGVEGFLAAVLAALVESSIAGTFKRLKVCRSETCQWAFYDSSKNACGTWCSMRSCGARAKAKAYRERKSLAAGASAQAAHR